MAIKGHGDQGTWRSTARRSIGMDRSFLVRLFGYRATFIHGDTLILDRWVWLKRRLPITANRETLIDIGCGTGAFSIGAAKRGYQALGLSWDARNQTEAARRAKLCGVNAEFEIRDVRELGKFQDYYGRFDVALCLENIEHILDDLRLMKDISRCLKPGGRLLLTTPNFYYRAISRADRGPFQPIENGGHVRRGYTPAMLRELCGLAGLMCDEISYCGGFFSQKTTAVMRALQKFHPLFAWLLTLPLRAVAYCLDQSIGRWSRYPGFSICMVAQKPRYAESARTGMSCQDDGLAETRELRS